MKGGEAEKESKRDKRSGEKSGERRERGGERERRERERVVSGTLYQGEDGTLLIHQRRQGPRKSMVVKQRANGDV